MQKMLRVLMRLGLAALILVLSDLTLFTAMAEGKRKCPVQLQSRDGDEGETGGKPDIILEYSAREIPIPRVGSPSPRESIQEAILNFVSVHARSSNRGNQKSFQVGLIYTLNLQLRAFAELLREGRGRQFFVYFADVKEPFGAKNLIDPLKSGLFRDLVKNAPGLHDNQIQIFLIADSISSFRDITGPLSRAMANPLKMLAPLLWLGESPFRESARRETTGFDLADFWGQMALGMELVFKSTPSAQSPDNPPKERERRGRGRPRKDVD